MPSRGDLRQGAEPQAEIRPPAVRVAGNDTTARTINEAIEEGRVTGSGPIGFVCECGALGCSTVLELSLEEYEHVREASPQFLVAPGHADPSDRVVVDVAGRYTIVAK